jgi:DNA-binding MarR family transcriptional regulator
MSVSSDECARELVEVVPLVMHAIRAEMRSHRGGDLSVPQFRALAFIGRHQGASLTDVADHIGLTLPSMSKMIDALVTRKMVARRPHPTDRRRLTLALTSHGETTLRSARQAVQAQLAQLLDTASADERAAIAQAMITLRLLFTPLCKAEE